MLDPRITGRIQYAQDQHMPGMLHARILRSPYAHARIVSINTAAVPRDVVCLTRDDVTDLEPLYGPMVKDQPVVARERVLHVGDSVVAVAAPTLREAEAALEAVEVEYEEMTGVFDPVEAAGDSSPVLHESLDYPPDLRPDGRNVCHRFRLQSGLGEDGFAGADVVMEEAFSIAGAAHVPMEPHATLAYWEGGRLHVITGTQTPFNVRRDLAALFRLPEERVRVVVAPMGGSFGAKTFMRLEAVTAALARKSGRPVRAVLTRAEEFVTSTVIRRVFESALEPSEMGPSSPRALMRGGTQVHTPIAVQAFARRGVTRRLVRTGSLTSLSIRAASTPTIRRRGHFAAMRRRRACGLRSA